MLIADPMNPRYLSADGERALLRAVKILETNPDRTQQAYLEALVQAGDWLMIKQSPSRAMPYYERAAKLIDEAEQSADASSKLPPL